MRILIDCTSITKNKAGVGVYAKNLIENLTLLAGGPEYFLLVQDDDPDFEYANRANVHLIRVRAKFFRKLPLRFLLEQFVVPALLLWHRIDVLHSLHYSFPLAAFFVKRVVTLHDMTFFTMPDAHERIKVIYFRFFIKADVFLADTVIFVSHSAMSDCIRTLGPLRGNGVVIHHGISEKYRQQLPASKIEKIKIKFGLTEDYILYVGTIEPRKNLERLVLAFSKLASSNQRLQLVIAGMRGWMYEGLISRINELDLAARIKFTGFVPEDDKPYLIGGAKVFAYPSLYEGFGIPVLEAMACGVPTITSNVSSLPEVVGDAALMIDPKNVNDLAHGLNRLLGDEDFAHELRQRAVAQALKFTWTNAASQTLKVYLDTAQSGPDEALREKNADY